MSSRRDYPEVLSDLANRFAVAFQGSGVTAALSGSLANIATEIIRRDWGGVSIYVPKGAFFDRKAVHREMYRKHRAGSTSRALAEEYGITVHAVNAALRRLRKEQSHDGN